MQRYEAFCKILEYGSFTRAAEALGYTQAAVSQMINSLENEFSLKLLVRTRNGVRLTPDGMQLYPIIVRMVGTKREITDKVNEINGLVSGEVRIGIFASIAQHVIPKVIRDFREIYPTINFVFYQGDNKSIPQWLKAGIIDFAFMYPSVATGFQTKVLAHEKILAVLPTEHKLAENKVINLEELADDPMIIIEEGGSINTVFDAFEKVNRTPNVRCRVQDDATVLAMVEEGLGVSFLSSMALEHTTYRFVKIPTEPSIERTIALAYENQAFLSVASKRFINFIIDNLDEYVKGEYIQTVQVDKLK